MEDKRTAINLRRFEELMAISRKTGMSLPVLVNCSIEWTLDILYDLQARIEAYKEKTTVEKKEF